LWLGEDDDDDDQAVDVSGELTEARVRHQVVIVLPTGLGDG
jgi:hypothetical protein